MHIRKNITIILALYSYMKRRLNFPSLIRWMLFIGCVLLVFMTVTRIGMFLFFNRQDNRFFDVSDAFVLGFRYDLRSVSIVLLVMLILGSLPSLHPFKTRSTEKIWLAFL